ncbi:MAG: HEAT repeat domain-containing protein [Myxococcota bacterium]
MPRLLHLAPEPLRKRIERSGLRGDPYRFGHGPDARDVREAVFAMPFLQDFSTTYQWVRELRRWRRTRLVAVTFRVPDDEPVLVGPYSQPKQRLPATQAVASLACDPWGNEIVVMRAVSAKAIVHVRAVRQDVGWEESPNPKHRSACVCPACLLKGSPDLMRRCRAIYNRTLQRVHSGSGDAEDVRRELRALELPLERVGKRLPAKRLLSLSRHHDERVRAMVTGFLGYFSKTEALDALIDRLSDRSPDVQRTSVQSLLAVVGDETWNHVRPRGEALQTLLVHELEWSWMGRSRRILARIAGEAESEEVRTLAADVLQSMIEDDENE